MRIFPSNLINGDINLLASQPATNCLIKTGKKYDVTDKTVCQNVCVWNGRGGNTGRDKRERKKERCKKGLRSGGGWCTDLRSGITLLCAIYN